MEPQIVDFKNKGMHQDTSISKSSDEFAFENRNIRIAAVNDTTLLSVTNEKGPSNTNISLLGSFLGKATIGDYVVIFTTSSTSDYIYKLYLEGETLTSQLLFQGHLNFSLEHPIEAISYYESSEVQKVYWVDGLNVTRVINIIQGTITSSENPYTGFDFCPEIKSIPHISIEKEYEGKGLFPAGTIQYFVAYYNKFGASTQIVAASGINYITKASRGAKADETCTCSFAITLSDLDYTHFKYVRVYSAIRSSLNGPREVKIVGDFEVPVTGNLTFSDTNINETVLADTDIYYLGGQYFVASTLDQKDNTAFFGDITIGDNINSAGIRAITDSWYNHSTKEHIKGYLRFAYKQISTTDSDGIYVWESQLGKSGAEMQTFKRGELYRFAIQFMTKTGEWTQAFFIGDLENPLAPKKVGGVYSLPCVQFTMPSGALSSLSDFLGYRLLIAEANYGNRKIIAQGVLCPTVFNYDSRTKGKAFSASSWIMRPRNADLIEARHYVPIINEIQNCHFDSLEEANGAELVPYMKGEENIKYLLVITASSGHNLNAFIGKCSYDNSTGNAVLLDSTPGNYRNIITENSNKWDTQLERIKKGTNDFGITTTTNLYPNGNWLHNMVNNLVSRHDAENNGFVESSERGSKDKNNSFVLNRAIPGLSTESGNLFTITGQYKHLAYKYLDSQAAGVATSNQSRAYFVDEQILTFHSPEIENVSDILDGTECKLRIVGLVNITANFGDYNMQVSTSGLSVAASDITNNVFNTQNISSIIKPIISPYLWGDYSWDTDGHVSSDHFDAYRVYMWHREGSLSGYSSFNDAEEFDQIPALLKHKVFGNLYFSKNTDYFIDKAIMPTYNDIKTVVYQDDEALRAFSWEGTTKVYSGQLDTLVTMPGNMSECYYPEARVDGISGEVDPVFTDEESEGRFRLYDAVRIKYRCTPHAVFSLGSNEILPRLEYIGSSEMDSYKEDEWDLYKILTGDDEGESAAVNNFSWLASGNALSDDFLFAGAYYMMNSSAEAMKQAIEKRGLSLEKDKTYYAVSLALSKTLDAVYGYEDENSGETYFICKDTTHPLYTWSYYYEDNIAGTEVQVLNKTMNSKSISPLWACPYGCSVIVDSRFIGPTVDFTELPVLEDIITGYYTVTWNGIAYIVQPCPQPEGIFSVNVGNYEYYLLNDKATPAHMRFENNHSVEVKAEDVFKTDFNQKLITSSVSAPGPYLFMAELYRDASGDELYGLSIDNLVWNPICAITEMNDSVTTSYGDTFYQRWDCLKTYPMTEEDVNSNVDITSFMVESHINLDARTDINRGTASLLNARPSNYNLFNTAYDQVDNIFQYNTLDEKYDNNRFSNQIVWSIPKTPMDNIDTWTQVSLINSLSLDGAYGPVNKILGINDTLLVFQDSAIASIHYNDRTMVSTEQNVPLQVANSGKVDGYTYASKINGCRNKWSICSTPSGVYFIDDNNKTLFNLGKQGLQDVSTTSGMSQWFKDNTNGLEWSPSNDGFRLNYDAITKDIYIENNDVCLLYNELLSSFTSFMRYEGKPCLFNLKGKSFITTQGDYSSIQNPVSIYKMFGGDFNKTFDGSYIDYSMQYNVNPEPYTDKIFTNIEYIADMLDSTKDINDPNNFVDVSPFSTLKVWNEYQYGSSDLHMKYTPSNLKRKFRIWRADIPRDENSTYKLDRIRNPWINLKLTGTPNNTNKMEFHNLLVKYYK